jgi:hypothetical protein
MAAWDEAVRWLHATIASTKKAAASVGGVVSAQQARTRRTVDTG